MLKKFAAQFTAPATLLMAKFRLTSKLLALSALMFLPLLYLAQHSIGVEMAATQSTRDELAGVRILADTAKAVRYLQDIRAASGAMVDNAARDKAAQSLAEASAVLARSLSAYPDSVVTREGKALLEDLRAISTGGKTGKAIDEAIRASLNLVDLAAEHSTLLLDPEAEPYYLMTLTVERLLPWTESLAGLREAGLAALAQSGQNGTLRAVQSRIDEVEADVRHVQRRINSLQRMNAGSINTLQAALDASGNAVAFAHKDVISLAGDPRSFADHASAARAAVHGLEDELVARLSGQLARREAAGTRTVWIAGSLSVLALLLLNYLMWGFYRGFMGAVNAIQKSVMRIADGDLSARIEIRGRDELADTGKYLEAMAEKLSAMVANIRNSAVMVTQSGHQLNAGAADLAVRTEQQAASLEQTSASLADLADNVRQSAGIAREVDQLAARAREAAETSNGAMEGAVRSMEEIQADASKVQEIITLINGIAFQTNILALNAAVEAARAGESGRGFAVVAAEVRNLAQRSAEASREIKQLIDQSASRVQTGVHHIDDVSGKLTGIVQGIREVAVNMTTISTTSADQSNAISEITEAVRQLDEITQNNGRMVERARVASAELEVRASSLTSAAGAFRLRQGVTEEAQAMVEAAFDLVQRHGNQAFAMITGDNGHQFVDRDMYVFVFDRTGTYRACAGQPARINQSISSVPGLDGPKLVADAFAPTTEDGSWVDYDIVNPVSGQVAHKTSYIRRISADMVIGCGIYRASV